MAYFGISNILEYGIFWNMEYFGIWNILEYRIFFIRYMAYFKTKQYFIIHKTYHPHFGIWNISEYGILWNMECFRICNILEYGIFFNMEYCIFSNETSFYSSQNLVSIFKYMAYFGIWNMT